MSVFIHVVILTIATSLPTLTTAQISSDISTKQNVQISSNSSNLKLEFDGSEISNQVVNIAGADYCELSIPGEGMVIEYGKPIMPMVSRFVIVPPQAGIRFNFHSDQPRIIQSDIPPSICTDKELAPPEHVNRDCLVFPPVAAEVTEPFIIRGVRLVKVITYPVQYDQANNCYIYNDRITTELSFTDDEPINPVRQSNRKFRSDEFRKFISALAINGDISRDDFVSENLYPGHYLVVTHEDCLPYIAPFIEWRRKAGYKMDILSIPDEIASVDTNTIKSLIQERYDEYINNGEDSFDQLLLVGDRSVYRNGPQAGWILEAKAGDSVWPQGPYHADYIYACLEGDDNYPDVGFSRFCAGVDSILELFTARTLAYEAEPYMESTDWFTRGAVYSQHWGNDAEGSAWHISIHSNLRWAEQLMKVKGFNDLQLFEDYEWDSYGGAVGRFERDVFDDGANLMLGRAEALYWENREELDENVVFPIRLTLSGHGEYGAWSLLRKGSGEHLKGPVAACCGWGGPPTSATNSVWLEMVNAMINRDLSYGWSRTLAVTISENYFSNFYFGARRVYNSMKTDIDFYGDPGLKPWFGVPRMVNAHFTESVTPDVSLIEVTVTDTSDNLTIPSAQVTLYAPGEIPAFDDESYADYTDGQIWTKMSSGDGIARFVFDENDHFVNDTPIYVTVIGRDIRPCFGVISIEDQDVVIEADEYYLTQSQGNNDAEMNPDEIFAMELIARNSGAESINNVTAIVLSSSSFLSIEGSDQIQFGYIRRGARAFGANEITFHISPDCPDGTSQPADCPCLMFDFTDGDRHWKSAIRLNPVAPNLLLKEVVDGIIVPFEDQRSLNLDLENVGGQASPDINAQLTSLGMGVIVNEDISQFSGIPAGDHRTLEDELFTVTADPRAVPGSKCRMMLVLQADAGYADTIYFEMQVGEAKENAPQGPDKYGYICYDDMDTDWENAPSYDWIEISTDERDPDFEGSLIEFTGQSDFDAGETMVIPLPYNFSFYGQNVDTITVCTNGYILPGNQERVINPQNWQMDRAVGGGIGMIAPFWDWLIFQENSQIYMYNDENYGRFIIEWYRLRHCSEDENDLTFQVILYDKKRWVKESGDSDILFQYKSIEDIAGDQPEHQDVPYASVGISSPDCLTGINYTFRNIYPVSSTLLENRRALLFTTSPYQHNGVVYGQVLEAESNQPIEGAVVYTGYGLTVETNSDGRYRIGHIAQGPEFFITVSNENFEDSTSFGLNLIERDSIEVNFSILPLNDIEPEYLGAPCDLAIESAYPNPFNSQTRIRFTLPRESHVSMTIYDVRGRRLEEFVSDRFNAGHSTVSWNGSDYPAGLYILRLEASSQVRSTKILLIK